MARKFLLTLVILVATVSACHADDLMDRSKLRMPQIDDMNMGKVLPNYTGTGTFVETESEGYNLRRMKQMNPDFTTYPESTGIIWLKRATYTRDNNTGGMNVARLYVILGRRGLSGKWLTWNIQTPAKGTAEILEASVYDANSLARISTVTPDDDITAGVTSVRFMGLPETFVLVIEWRETLPDALSIEGVSWFQEDLRVWESVTEIHSPQKLTYRAFPEPVSPETDDLGTETVYTWRRVNVEPMNDASDMARLQRAGVVFSTKQGNSGLQGMMKDVENAGNISAPSDALTGFKRSPDAGATKLVEWLMSQPEISLAEGTPRKIPATGAWTKREKLLLAKLWLTSQKVNASLSWRLPFDTDDRTPICPAMFTNPVLDVQDVKGVTFHDMNSPELIGGEKIVGLNSEGRLFTRRVPSTKASDNRLSAVMDLKLNENGVMNGTVRLILRGAWKAFLVGANPTDGAARGAVLSLFPALTNYKDVKYRVVKGVPEIVFTVDNKPGIGGTGRGMLAILPFFEPVPMRKLGTFEPPVEVKFPFIVDQSITLSFPKNASEALVSGKTGKNPDRINYSDNYQNRRRRLEASSRFELNMSSVSAGNMTLLRRCLESWRVFSAKHIPVR